MIVAIVHSAGMVGSSTANVGTIDGMTLGWLGTNKSTTLRWFW
jgi:hypothetical protein